MRVTPETIDPVLKTLIETPVLAVDCETTGLGVYTGDKLFSVVIATKEQEFYFDDSGLILKLKPLFETDYRTWVGHNLKFDYAMLKNEGLEITGHLHCTMIAARVLYNDHLSYSLDSCASRIGLSKSDAVKDYIKEHKLYHEVQIPGRKGKKKVPHFQEVPLEIMQPYAEQDARVTFQLYLSQLEEFEKTPALLPVFQNEMQLLRVVEQMERTGIRVDTNYCARAMEHEAARKHDAMEEFFGHTGKVFLDSPKSLAMVFESEIGSWSFTEKGNPSFESSVLEKFQHPAAKQVLIYRDAKSRHDFYSGFLHYSDSWGYIHPSLNQAGTASGRFSSSEPNFQNLTAESDLEGGFLIRRALVPHQGFVICSMDYKAVEYVITLGYCCKLMGRLTPLAKKVLGGLDFHDAVGGMIKEATGMELPRKSVKVVNFSILYGAGLKKIAESLGCSELQAKQIRDAIFNVAPELGHLISVVSNKAKNNGSIKNWMGRLYQFPDPKFSYKALNYLIQGSAADVIKVAMIRIGEYLKDKKSFLSLQVHDELVFNIHESEYSIINDLKDIMEKAYPATYLPLKVDVELSTKSFGDLIKYMGVV